MATPQVFEVSSITMILYSLYALHLNCYLFYVLSNPLFSMKRIALYFTIILACFSCNKNSTQNNTENSTENTLFSEEQHFVTDGISFTVIPGCPIDTRSQSEDYKSCTIIAERNRYRITLYLDETKIDEDFIRSDTYLSDGVLATTSFVRQGKIVKYVQWPDAKKLPYTYVEPETRMNGWGRRDNESYADCVDRCATDRYNKVTDNMFDRISCKYIPCEELCFLVALFDCLEDEPDDPDNPDEDVAGDDDDWTQYDWSEEDGVDDLLDRYQEEADDEEDTGAVEDDTMVEVEEEDDNVEEDVEEYPEVVEEEEAEVEEEMP